MNYEIEELPQITDAYIHYKSKAELQNKIVILSDWQKKAIVQLEHFRMACRIYNFCDEQQVNELLSNRNVD